MGNDLFNTYIISLKNSPRRNEISENMRFWGASYTVTEAVDGRGGNLDKKYKVLSKNINYIVGRDVSDGEVACLSSHHNVYKELVTSKFDYAVIFEDDCVPSFECFQLVNDIVNLSDFDFDIVSFFSGFSIVDKKYIKTINEKSLRRITGRMDHAVGYLISKKMAIKILEENENQYKGLADWPIDLAKNSCFITEINLVQHININSSLDHDRKNETSINHHILKFILSTFKLSSLLPFRYFKNYYLKAIFARRNIGNNQIIQHKDN